MRTHNVVELTKEGVRCIREGLQRPVETNRARKHVTKPRLMHGSRLSDPIQASDEAHPGTSLAASTVIVAPFSSRCRRRTIPPATRKYAQEYAVPQSTNTL
jgi:hypothetical protein